MADDDLEKILKKQINERLDEIINSQQDNTDNNTTRISEDVINNNHINNNNNKKKSNIIGNIGLGIVGAGVATVYAGKKLWDFFYPPNFKRYLSVGILAVSLYSVSHCDKVKEVAKDYIKDTKQIVLKMTDKNTAVNKLNKKITKIINQYEAQKKQQEQFIKEYKEKYALIKKNNLNSSANLSKNQSYIRLKKLKKEPVYFVEQKGTTLARIAKKITGDASNWKKIAEYNHKKIINPGKQDIVNIKIGELLKIPSEYVANSSGIKYFGVVNNPDDNLQGAVPKEFYLLNKNESFNDSVRKVTGSYDNVSSVIDYNKRFLHSFDKNTIEIIRFPSNLVKNHSLLKTNLRND